MGIGILIKILGIPINKGTPNKDSNNEKASNVKETKGKTFIPQTGESYICIIMIIIVIVLAIIFRKKSKKNK